MDDGVLWMSEKDDEGRDEWWWREFVSPNMRDGRWMKQSLDWRNEGRIGREGMGRDGRDEWDEWDGWDGWDGVMREEREREREKKRKREREKKVSSGKGEEMLQKGERAFCVLRVE